MKRVYSVLLLIALVLSMCACSTVTSTPDAGNNKNADLSAFYEKVSESQGLMDAVADDIYSNWYDAIYKDKFNENINTAILMAQIDHAEDLEKIEALDKEIAELFKSAKESECSSLVKQVMSAYSDYYEFVVNVSGSFNSYSASKETLKKELASLLRDLSYEL